MGSFFLRDICNALSERRWYHERIGNWHIDCALDRLCKNVWSALELESGSIPDPWEAYQRYSQGS